MSDTLTIRNWRKWQSYRSDRGQPPWIKVHRCVMRDPEWVSLTDAQRGQLVAMWLLAADRDGVIPASPVLIRKLCFLDEEPNLQLFVEKGFIEADANVASQWRQHDVPEAEAETEAEAEKNPPSHIADAMVRVRAVYPKRTGGHRWGEVKKRLPRVLKTTPLDDVLKAIQAYSDVCDAMGRTGTEKVMQAATFFGTAEGWLEDWQVHTNSEPRGPNTGSLRSQLEAM